ncbi:microtubule-associated protein [Aureococcus anophagefferens]|uniref:Microtubule-associated protein n=1 Tax=Aureococcus anophagefferens TaxID=44056 RepID=A0ABR1G2L8_AURAN
MELEPTTMTEAGLRSSEFVSRVVPTCPTEPTELPLAADEALECWPDESGWWYARKRDGSEGYVPRTFIVLDAAAAEGDDAADADDDFDFKLKMAMALSLSGRLPPAATYAAGAAEAAGAAAAPGAAGGRVLRRAPAPGAGAAAAAAERGARRRDAGAAAGRGADAEIEALRARNEALEAARRSSEAGARAPARELDVRRGAAAGRRGRCHRPPPPEDSTRATSAPSAWERAKDTGLVPCGHVLCGVCVSKANDSRIVDECRVCRRRAVDDADLSLKNHRARRLRGGGPGAPSTA